MKNTIKLHTLLLEGLYDKITGEVSKAVFKVMNDATKVAKDTESKYKGIQVRRDPPSTNSISDLFQTETQSFYVGGFGDNVSGLDVEVELKYAITGDGVKQGKFFIDGFAEADDDYQNIEIHIAVHPSDGTKIFSKIQPVLRDLIRHEIEHITQRGTYAKAGKWMRKNDKIRDKIASNPDLYYKYFLLPDEVDANIHGLYAKAKTMKQPYQKVIDDYLDSLVSDKVINPEHRREIYNKWKQRIPKIGGIPNLK
jgi:hypothetical protein